MTAASLKWARRAAAPPDGILKNRRATS